MTDPRTMSDAELASQHHSVYTDECVVEGWRRFRRYVEEGRVLPENPSQFVPFQKVLRDITDPPPCPCAARLDRLEPKLTSDLAFLRGQVESILEWVKTANDYHAKIDRLEREMRHQADQSAIDRNPMSQCDHLADKIAAALGNQEGSR